MYRFDVVGVVVVLVLLVAWFGSEGGGVIVYLALTGVEVSETVHSVVAACRRTSCPLLAGGGCSTESAALCACMGPDCRQRKRCVSAGGGH